MRHDTKRVAAGPEVRKQGLAAIVSSETRLLILGSLPGDDSLKERRYYAHRSNQFWRLVGGVIGADLAALDYEARLARLAAARIGLWDVIASAVRTGSLDQAIKDAEVSDLAALAAGLPELRAVAFNGAKAAAIGTRRLEGIGLELIALPSSSAACTIAFAEKARKWAVLRRVL